MPIYKKKDYFSKCIITIGKHELEQVKQMKYLGLLSDKN